MEFFDSVTALKYNSTAFIALYTGFMITLIAIPFSYIEFISINNYKEFVLRINNKKKFNSMISKGIFLLILIELSFVFGVMCVISRLLPKSEFRIISNWPAFIIYILTVYLISIWYYKLSIFRYGHMFLIAFIMVFHLNNVFPLVKNISIPYILLNGDSMYLYGCIVILSIITLISLRLNLKKENA